MLSSKDKRIIKKRLHYIKGQMEGIEKMIDEDREPSDIHAQFKAVEGALQKAIYVVLDEALRSELAVKIVNVVNACPGNCEDAEKIKFIKKEFPNLDLKKVVQILPEINVIDKKLTKNE
jgi:DNA-binding FrmR family transcriptional regulator